MSLQVKLSCLLSKQSIHVVVVREDLVHDILYFFMIAQDVGVHRSSGLMSNIKGLDIR